MRIKKSILFKFGLAVAALLLMFAVFEAVISIAVSERRLKEEVPLFFKENFSKAVNFGDIGLDFRGNIVITNLDVSIASDFNDNISLVKCGRVVIKCNLAKLVAGTMLVDEIILRDAEISLVKKYGKDYSEFLRDVFLSGKRFGDMRGIDFSGFYISIRGARFRYVEGFRNNKLEIGCRDISADVGIEDEKIHYSVKGSIEPFNSAEISRGLLKLAGSGIITNRERIHFSTHQAVIENFDLSYLNVVTGDSAGSPLSMFGGISADIAVNTYNDALSVSGGVRFNNLGIARQDGRGVLTIIANENLNIDLVTDVLRGGARYVVRKCDIYDSAIRVSLSGIYGDNGSEKYISVSLHSGKNDLDSLSERCTPWRDVTYGGVLSADGRLYWDMLHGILHDVSLTVALEDAEAVKNVKRVKKELVRDLHALVSVQNGRLICDVGGFTGISDLSLKYDGFVNGWAPFSSSGSLGVQSKTMDAAMLASALSGGISSLIEKAYADSERGYEEIFFLKKPAGVFTNNNNVNCAVAVDSLRFAGGARLRNIMFNVAMNDGYVRSGAFSCTGYGGMYFLDISGYLKSDQPSLAVKAKCENFDIGAFAHDSKISGEVGGSMNIDIDYSMNGYRLSHLLANTKGAVTVTLNSAYLNNTMLQKRLKSYLDRHGFQNIGLNRLSLLKATATLSQQYGGFYISNYSIMGDTINAQGFGGYDYFNGLNVPCAVSCKIENPETQVMGTTTIPLLITGGLLNPTLWIANKKDVNGLSLFNVD